MTSRGGKFMEKRIMLLCVVGFFAILVLTSPGISLAAAKYPSEPINNVCLFGPGDQADLFNRLLSKHFEKSLGVPLITVNKPGGGGAVGFTYLTSQKPDGYTIGIGTIENMIVPTLTEGKPPYVPEDLHILGQVATIYNVLVVPANSPWKTFQEFVDHARKNPGVKFGSPGIRSTIYLRMETLNKNAKLGLVGVPFDSSAEATSAVMGGHVPVGIWDLGSARAQQAAGKVRILFIFESPVAAGLDPKTPWMGTLDKNIAEKDVDISHCLVVLAKAPDDVKRVLKATLEKVVKDPDYLADLKKMELMPNYVDGNIIMEKKRSARIEQVKAFYKEMGWLK
jgi:tripartite-type tricarboxylate transporter receptor subunit TctC